MSHKTIESEGRVLMSASTNLVLESRVHKTRSDPAQSCPFQITIKGNRSVSDLEFWGCSRYQVDINESSRENQVGTHQDMDVPVQDQDGSSVDPEMAGGEERGAIGELKTTISCVVSDSQNIASQQRRLITKRNKQDFSSEDTSISSPKRLKRDKIPSPLNISPNGRGSTPKMRSAPLTRSTNRRNLVRHQSMFTQGFYPGFYPYLQQPQQIGSQMQSQFQLQPLVYGYRPVLTAIPYTANRVHFLRPQGSSASSSSGASTSTSSGTLSASSSIGFIKNPVVDVYPTGETREAPTISQPLSAQEFHEQHNAIGDEDNEPDQLTTVEELKGEIKLNDDVFLYSLQTTEDSYRDKEAFLQLCLNAWDEFHII